ncbi:hypothetical protein KCT17_003644 [Escherichia coli]|nr:hypothetical protein [Escherichia coli]
MKRVLTMMVLVLLVGCKPAAPTVQDDNKIIEQSKQALVYKLSKTHAEGRCERAQRLADYGAGTRRGALSICDSIFDVNNEYQFSDVKLYRNPTDGAYVCGIISGWSEISRIGARFIIYLKNGKTPESLTDIYIVKSKYPIGSGEVRFRYEFYHGLYAAKCK